MRVPVAVKVGAFALILMGSYTYYANSIPQIQSKPPPSSRSRAAT
jgi:hypothetical protein